MRAYQYRFYPTAAQRLLLDRYFGTARWAWNHALERRSKAYRRREESITGIDVSRAITQIKKTSRKGLRASFWRSTKPALGGAPSPKCRVA